MTPETRLEVIGRLERMKLNAGILFDLFSAIEASRSFSKMELYDISFLLRAYGIKTMNCAEDTMLLSHALQPEGLKGLGYLGSIYSDEGAWEAYAEER